MIIEVNNRYLNTYKHKNDLKKLGLKFNNDEKKWFLETDSKTIIKRVRKFCFFHALCCLVYPKQAARSADYRYNYFQNNPAKNGKYRCAYCFQYFPKKMIEIDHIIPVLKVKKSRTVRMVIRAAGYSSVNDLRNLTASCPYCNHKKGTKAGLWVIRGHLGKLKYYPLIYYGGAVFLLWLCVFELILLVTSGNLSFECLSLLTSLF